MKYLYFLTSLIVSNVAFAAILGFNKTGGGSWDLTAEGTFDSSPTGNDTLLIKPAAILSPLLKISLAVASTLHHHLRPTLFSLKRTGKSR
jgi:hypothetical protein